MSLHFAQSETTNLTVMIREVLKPLIAFYGNKGYIVLFKKLKRSTRGIKRLFNKNFWEREYKKFPDRFPKISKMLKFK